ncbi:MoaD/ThiS family protein [Candidatus Bathyarchaeota archaeon]|nr:MoaD/ThiS family protein [Candidatus Bathyarchaeota archaeon]MBS7613845.1 MoaD/ThiS family protein [Candidatus Bathyarchaeota archaeon]MBS7617095.1 MoaD/ThiS family protein [Candidatus Bathyarchaeota archaeon]
MKVKVNTYGFIAQKLGSRLEVELKEEATVKDLISKLSEQIKGFDLTQEVVLVNGKAVKQDHPINDGDEVTIMPAIVGG